MVQFLPLLFFSFPLPSLQNNGWLIAVVHDPHKSKRFLVKILETDCDTSRSTIIKTIKPTDKVKTLSKRLQSITKKTNPLSARRGWTCWGEPLENQSTRGNPFFLWTPALRTLKDTDRKVLQRSTGWRSAAVRDLNWWRGLGGAMAAMVLKFRTKKRQPKTFKGFYEGNWGIKIRFCRRALFLISSGLTWFYVAFWVYDMFVFRQRLCFPGVWYDLSALSKISEMNSKCQQINL